jgi:predicted lipoprotein with Yx(FWY)xxD motif
MIRRVTFGIALGAAALGFAAPASSAATLNSISSASAGSSKTVAVRQLDGIGRVLVDSSGDALYTPEQKMLCSGACNAFWKPLSPGSGTPTAAAGVGKLGIIKRADGSRQVTVKGRPLYSFVEDSPGKVNGNGFKDAFGSQHFTWHVVRPGGMVATVAKSVSKSSVAKSAPKSSSSGYGSGSSSSYGGGGSGGSYNY